MDLNKPQSQKTILILTADAGFGHRSAANAVAAAFENEYKDVCKAVVINPLEDKRSPFFLRESQSDYDKIVKNMPELYKFGYEASDAAVPVAIVESALTVLLYEAIRDILNEYQPDAILTTYPLYQAPVNAFLTISGHNIPFFAVITDLATVHRIWFNKNVDGCIVPTETVRDLAVANGVSEKNVFIKGIPVHPKIVGETRSKKEIRKALGWEPDLPTFLAVGSKRVEGLSRILHVVNHFGAPLQLAVVAGKDKELYEQLQANRWHIPTHLYEFTTDMPLLMHGSDAIICKAGGLIVTEALASRLPMILIDVIPGQEEGNAEYVITNGAGDLAGSTEEALEIIAHLLMDNSALLKERAGNAAALSKPFAAQEIAGLVYQSTLQHSGTAQKHRLANRPTFIKLLTQNQISWQDETQHPTSK